MKYALVTVSEQGEHVERIFNSQYHNLELDPYGNNCPIVVGSNQAIRLVEDLKNPTIDRSLRLDFDYDCECGFHVCNECGYPVYPMEAAEGEDCPNCEFGIMLEYKLTLKCS